ARTGPSQVSRGVGIQRSATFDRRTPAVESFRLFYRPGQRRITRGLGSIQTGKRSTARVAANFGANDDPLQ
ncbi:MAG: hypothetical protein MI861_16345, partial [Pirellulales bacterium]|nr:hypothetical protein [Pirellulales bacterium]